MYTTKCAGTCAYPGDWTLRQSLYVNNAPTQVIEKRFSPSGQMYRVDVEWPTSAVKRKWEAVGYILSGGKITDSVSAPVIYVP
ncbi:hypothetical protein [Nostoc sp.]|uniref:hypothetical protein n=1 Tax=Nostoc sp. TaxID=1180 RepID=UPI002FF9F28E